MLSEGILIKKPFSKKNVVQVHITDWNAQGKENPKWVYHHKEKAPPSSKNGITGNHEVSSRNKFILLFCPILAYFRDINSVSYGHAFLTPEHIKSSI